MLEELQRPVDELSALRKAFELVRQPVFVVDAHNERIVDANPAACEVMGIARGELIGRSWSRAAGRLPDVTLRDVDVHGRRFIAVAREPEADATEAWSRLRDALTGLPSRSALLARMAWHEETRPLARLALLFIDMDNFKRVNDTWGHVAGDRVLRVVAERLGESIRPNDLVVRYGGDEFVVLVEGVRRRRDLERVARRIRRGVERPILIHGHEYVPSVTIGIARRNANVSTIESMIEEADRAMYRARAENAAVARESAKARSQWPAACSLDDPLQEEFVTEPV